jgi:hypothetical protein
MGANNVTFYETRIIPGVYTGLHIKADYAGKSYTLVHNSKSYAKLSRDDYGRVVNPSVNIEGPTGRAVLRVIEKFCKAHGLPMAPPKEV